jgi:hypothetical protein
MKMVSVQQLLSTEAPPSHLSSRPKRTRISYFALPATTTGAVCRKGNRMNLIKATGLHRKSGGAQWRDLRFGGSFLEMFFLQSLRDRGETGKPARKKGTFSAFSALFLGIRDQAEAYTATAQLGSP